MNEQIVAPAKKSLISKLAEACNAVGAVEKKGSHPKYKYVKAADIAKAIRHELFSRNIIVIVDEKEYTSTRTVKTNSGGEMAEYLLKCDVTFLDGDSDQKIGPYGAFGIAMSLDDKGLYKAKTGCLKYVLRTIGLIPDEKDDPEADTSVDDAVHEAEYEQKLEGQRRIAAYQITAFDNACHQSGKTAEQVAEFLKTKCRIASISDMMRSEFAEAIKWANGNSDLRDDIVTSIQAAKAKKKAANAEPAQPMKVVTQ